MTKSTNPHFTPAQIPMLFKAEMIEAMLCGHKTETRRIVNPQPVFDGGIAAIPVGRGPKSCAIYAHELNGIQAHFFPARCEVGDLIWCKETHFQAGKWVETGELTKTGREKIRFDRVPMLPVLYQTPNQDQAAFEKGAFTYFTRPSLFMERTDSRLTLRVTSYGIERLHDIDEAGAIAEGVQEVPNNSLVGRRAWRDYQISGATLLRPVSSYQTLWASINGEQSWDANPWVEVIKFEVIKQNVVKVAAA